MEEQARIERTPYNNQADYNEVDHSFRTRLDSMVPTNLSKRIQEILSKRMKEENKAQEG